MILIIDALNKHHYSDILEDMFRLRARVFGGRLGWEVTIQAGQERDQFDDLDPAYIIALDPAQRVIGCMRALQTTGPHMLSDVFNDILDGQPPLRSATIWEATRFCVDTDRIVAGEGMKGISRVTSELNIAALEYAIASGITDVIAVVDPIMDRVLRRSGNGAYDYLGKTVQMGKARALAGLIDCTPERLQKVRSFSGISGSVMIDETALRAQRAALEKQKRKLALPLSPALAQYFVDQIDAANDIGELDATLAMTDAVLGRRSFTPRKAPAQLHEIERLA